MGNNLVSQAPSTAIESLRSKYTILSQDFEQGIWLLKSIDKKEQFVLKEIITNDERQKNRIEEMVEKKKRDNNPYMLRLQEHVFEKLNNYCSIQYKGYLIFEKPFKSLRVEMKERKFKGTKFDSDELMSILETGVLGLKYLKQINQTYISINSCNICLSKDGVILLSDPWMNDQSLQSHSYPSPESQQTKTHIQPNDWISSQLFSLGMVVLQMYYLDFMDSVYGYNNQVNYSLLNNKVNGIKDQDIRSYVQYLLGSKRKRLLVIPQIQTFVEKYRQSQKISISLPCKDKDKQNNVKIIEKESDNKQQQNPLTQNKNLKSVITQLQYKQPSQIVQQLPKKTMQIYQLPSIFKKKPLIMNNNLQNIHPPIIQHIHKPLNLQKIAQPKSFADLKNKYTLSMKDKLQIELENLFEPLPEMKNSGNESSGLATQISQHQNMNSLDDMSRAVRSSEEESSKLPSSSIQSEIEEVLRSDYRDYLIRYSENEENQEEKYDEHQQKIQVSYNEQQSSQDLQPECPLTQEATERAKAPHTRKMNSVIMQVSDSENRSDGQKQSQQDGVIYSHSNISSNQKSSSVVVEHNQIGSHYQGQKLNGKKNGFGKFTYQDGAYVQGIWKDDQLHGHGKLYYSNGKLAYDGQYHMGSFHGFGRAYNNQPSLPSSQINYKNFNTVTQQWQSYQGFIKHQQKHGKGKLIYITGDYFQGQFKQDKMNGKGKFVKKNGQIIKGIWIDNKLVEQILV